MASAAAASSRATTAPREPASSAAAVSTAASREGRSAPPRATRRVSVRVASSVSCRSTAWSSPSAASSRASASWRSPASTGSATCAGRGCASPPQTGHGSPSTRPRASSPGHPLDATEPQVEELGSQVESCPPEVVPVGPEVARRGLVCIDLVEQREPVAGGGEPQLQLRRPCRLLGERVDLRGEALPVPIGLRHQRRDLVGAAGEPLGTRVEVLPTPGPSGRLRALERDGPDGLVEGGEPRRDPRDLVVRERGERAAREAGPRAVGGLHRGGPVCDRPVVGGEVAPDRGGTGGLGQGADPVLVLCLRRLERGELRERAGTPPTSVGQGPCRREHLSGGTLEAGRRVELRHRRGHPRVEDLDDPPQPLRHRRGRGIDERHGRRLAVRETGIGQHVLDAEEVGGQRQARALELGTGGPPLLGEPRLDVAEGPDVEQPLEHLPAVLGSRPEEGGEVTLGEQDHLGELRHAHAEGVLDDVGDLVVAGAQSDPATMDPLLERDQRLDAGPARAPLLGPQELWRAPDPQPPRAGGDVEGDPRHGIRRRVVAPQPVLGPGSRHVGIQREADRVEEARLSRTRRPVNEEQPLGGQRIHVDDDVPREGAERLDLQPVDPHAAPADPLAERPWSLPSTTPSSSPTWRASRVASTASPKRARSSSVAGRPPRTWVRKSQQTSTSDRDAGRTAYRRRGTATPSGSKRSSRVRGTCDAAGPSRPGAAWHRSA